MKVLIKKICSASKAAISWKRMVTKLLYVVLSLPLLYGLWLLMRICLFDYFTIPSGSMLPTLQIGDKVVVNKLLMGGRIYKDLHFDLKGQELESWRLKGLRTVQYNDICVFNFPHHGDKMSFVINNVFCKRCIGLPGDTIWVNEGYYKNNNYTKILSNLEGQRQMHNTPDSLLMNEGLTGRHCMGWTLKEFGPYYLPRQGEVTPITTREGQLYYRLLEWELGAKITWDLPNGIVYADGQPIDRHTWQHNYYFMAGDNVCASNDSRYWGLVPEEYIVGIVSLIIRDGQWLSIADD